MIRLKYDTPSHAESYEQKLLFRIFYWSAYIGRNEIVEKFIRLGYSPFIKSIDQKNPLMGAVESGKIETVKLILSFNYVPTNQRFFKKSQMCKDENGNNVLHLAYKYNQMDAYSILKDNAFNFQKRNRRGLLPH